MTGGYDLLDADAGTLALVLCECFSQLSCLSGPCHSFEKLAAVSVIYHLWEPRHGERLAEQASTLAVNPTEIMQLFLASKQSSKNPLAC